MSSAIQAPNNIAVDASGYVYVTESYSGFLWKVPAAGGTAVHLATFTPHLGGVAVDGSNNVYLSDDVNNAIIKLPAGGGAAVTIATVLSPPANLAIDPAGNVFFSRGDGIYMIPAGGGTPIGVSQGFLNLPTDIMLDKFGNLFELESGAGVIKKIVRSGGYFINPALPQGLILNENTGTISGTPTIAGPATNYTVSAFNSSGSISKNISITVSPAVNSHFANLSGLKLSAGTLSPAFSPATTSYTATVATGARTLQITPSTLLHWATIKVNGIVVADSATTPVPLNVGTNTITIVVTAPDGATTQSYTLTVTRPGSALDNLSSLIRSNGELSPVFSEVTTSYTSNVVHEVTQMTVTPTTVDPDAVIKVNGMVVPSGTTSPEIPLAVFSNTISIVVTSSDGTATQTYTLTVNRAVSDNDKLSNLTTNSPRPALFPAACLQFFLNGWASGQHYYGNSHHPGKGFNGKSERDGSDIRNRIGPYCTGSRFKHDQRGGYSAGWRNHPNLHHKCKPRRTG